MVKTNLTLIAALIAAVALLVSMSGTGSFFSSSVLSVSKTTINGVDKFIVLMSAGGQGDSITAEITKASYPIFNTDKTIGITAMKDGGTYAYTLADRSGASGTIVKYSLLKSCNGWLSCGVSTLGAFRDQCKADNINNIYYNAGSLENPKLRCYRYAPEYKVSDFDMVSGLYSPSINVYVDEWTGQSGYSTLLAQYTANLNRQTTFKTLEFEGKTIGTVSLEGQLGTFQTPPAASGIKAIRYVSDPTHYYVIPASSLANAELARDNFGTCMQQASSYNVVAIPPIPGFPLGFSFAEFMNEQQTQGCIDQYNSAIATLPYIFPSGDFASLDVSKLSSEGKATLKDIYTIPTMKFELDADAIGISRPIATPVSADCNDKTLAGSQATGEFTATVTNGGNAGLIYVEASCPSPYTVTTSGGTYYFQPYQTQQISIAISMSPYNQTKQCTVSARAGDLSTSPITGTCNIAQSSACSNTPKEGFYLDQWCHEYCPLTKAMCQDPKVLKTPATGYANLCICEEGTTPPTCNNNNVCEAGETIANCPNDCKVSPPINASSCMPFVQKINTEQVGATSIFGITFGGTTVQSCVWDFPVLAAALLVLAGALLLMKKEKYAKVVGITGLLLLVLSFVADNATLLALGGVGILLIVGVVAAVYVALRLHLI